MIKNHKGTKLVKDGEDLHALQKTSCSILSRLIPGMNALNKQNLSCYLLPRG